jgi:NAD(P)-dependent dehydrogenase (short-subunit alcohol dehydrogenase family)
MRVAGRTVIVTGGAQGLGAALVREAHNRGARVGVIDVAIDAARTIASEVGGAAAYADVAVEAELAAAIKEIEAAVGPVDVFISNAGISDRVTDPFTSLDRWQALWQTNTLPTVLAARILLPRMLARGEGHLVATGSGNALTMSPTDMAYSVTKHAQLAAMEWLAVTYGRRGIGVTCFCPNGMRTPMLEATAASGNAYARRALALSVTPDSAARTCFEAVEADAFMAVTLPQTMADFIRKGQDYQAWISSAEALQARYAPDTGLPVITEPSPPIDATQ